MRSDDQLESRFATRLASATAVACSGIERLSSGTVRHDVEPDASRVTRAGTLLLLAAVSSNPMQTTTGMRAAPASAPTPTALLSASAAEAVRHFEDAVAAEQSAFRTLPVPGGAGPNLGIRVGLEQAMRRAIDSAVDPLSSADRTAVSAAIWQRISAVDAANTGNLKSILPMDGWFRSRRDGAEVARDAWLIVQHSPDQAFQDAVVARMRPLVASGAARGADYALLYDRTEMFVGRPQLYGRQVTCSGGRWQAASTADPAGLDRRRAEMGLPLMVEYLKNFKGGC